jgi:hypothetical protein
MIIIKHRVNSSTELKNLSHHFGVEIDIRSNNNKLILSHDPSNKKAELFENWIKYYSHQLLVLNVKEEGLEELILKILKKNKIKKYFFLDQSMPTIIKNKNILIVCSGRISKYESIQSISLLKNKIKWLWIDYYNKEWIKSMDQILNLKKKYNYKICLVSPELHSKQKKTSVNYKKKLLPYLQSIDAVCTKEIDLWSC